MSRWCEYDFDDVRRWNQIKQLPGVYVVYADLYPVYVGQSTNIRTRLANHRFRRGYTNYIVLPWEKCLNLTIKVKYSKKYGDWAMLELRLIKHLQPKYNCVGSIRKRAVR